MIRSAHRAALLAVFSSVISIALGSVSLVSVSVSSRSVSLASIARAQDETTDEPRDAGFVGEDAEPLPSPDALPRETTTIGSARITRPLAITPPVAVAPPGVASGAAALTSIVLPSPRRSALEIPAPAHPRSAELQRGPTEPSALPAGVGPITWADARGSDCHQFHKRRVCDGPRRVPLASLEALDRQRALGLDQPRVAHLATGAPAPQAWIDAIPAGSDAGLLWPVPTGRLWRGFGIHHRLARTKSGHLRQLHAQRRHEGVDIGAHEGTPIVAAADGLVVYSDNGMHGYGNSVIVAHRDGSITQYSHCSATYVAAGDLVTRGQVIAAVGDTGLAHGAHLHFEWRLAGRSRDPLRHFEGRPSAPPSTAPSD